MSQSIEQKLTDPTFRKSLVSNPSEYAKHLGFSDDSTEYVVVKNTKDTINLVFGNPSVVVDLDQISAAGGGMSASIASGIAYKAWKQEYQRKWGTGNSW